MTLPLPAVMRLPVALPLPVVARLAEPLPAVMRLPVALPLPVEARPRRGARLQSRRLPQSHSLPSWSFLVVPRLLLLPLLWPRRPPDRLSPT